MYHFQDLSEPFKLALTRIFRIFDQDHDNALNDKELKKVQEYCFDLSSNNFKESDVEGLKQLITEHIDEVRNTSTRYLETLHAR